MQEFNSAQVISVYKNHYLISTQVKVFRAVLSGQMHFHAYKNEDFPTVGDWVKFHATDNSEGIISSIEPRTSLLKRKSVGNSSQSQLIAANIDSAFLAMSVDANFSLNRLDRMIHLCQSSGITPIVLLTKTDLIEECLLKEKIDSIKKRHPHKTILCFTKERKESIKSLDKNLTIGLCYCFIGSSGVGKSTIVNLLLNQEVMKTQLTNAKIQKGLHTTTTRHLFTLTNGAKIIDTPGMKEFGVLGGSDLSSDFLEPIALLAKDCRYRNCTHTNEPSCAVLKALSEKTLNLDIYNNWLKLRKEEKHFEESSQARKYRNKRFGKLKRRFKK